MDLMREESMPTDLKLYQNDPFMRYNRICIERVLENSASVYTDICKEAVNPYGGLHGGMIASLADCAAGAAACSGGNRYVTMSSTMNYLKTAAHGRVRAKAEVRWKGKQTAMVSVELFDCYDQLLACGSYTMYCVEKGTQT